jgi:hypothetical protein
MVHGTRVRSCQEKGSACTSQDRFSNTYIRQIKKPLKCLVKLMLNRFLIGTKSMFWCSRTALNACRLDYKRELLATPKAALAVCGLSARISTSGFPEPLPWRMLVNES